MPTVFIAGATGYLGRFLCAEYRRCGWSVKALARNRGKALDSALDADEIIDADVTKPEQLSGHLDGVELVVSALGITRQKDGLGYEDVDYQANLNLLEEAERAGVRHFGYIHVLNADKMTGVALIDAKQKFVDRLQASPISSTIVAPSGYFSDMADFLAMAKGKRVLLFGDGALRINPIHGEDLAKATAVAIEDQQDWLDVGGPETFTHEEIAELAFAVIDKPVKVVHLPDWLRRAAIPIVRTITPVSFHGPIDFFLNAFGHDMVGEQKGSHSLKDHFSALAKS